MKNFIVRTITSVFFVAAVVTSFLNPRAMTLLFSIVTGMTIWEFAGLVNDRPYTEINRFICTVSGVYLFLAMAGYNSGLTPATVFIPYLVSIIYLMVAELYLKAKDPINNWAYTMLSQLYIALPLSLLNVLAFRSNGYEIQYTYLMPLSVFVFLWINDAGAYCVGSLLGKEGQLEGDTSWHLRAQTGADHADLAYSTTEPLNSVTCPPSLHTSLTAQ